MAVIFISMVSMLALNTLRTYAEEIPTEDKIKTSLQNKGENSKIYDRNGVLLYTFKDPERDREYANYDEIPATVIAATLAAEDKDFFIHEGIDYLGMLRGVVTTITSNGGHVAGGSTVTQQLVKQTLLSSEQTLDRKIKEAMIALFVERDYSKEEILEYYLNAANFGGRVEGIKTAAFTYFNKPLGQINLNEAIFLISLVQSPGEYSPLYATDKEKAGILSDNRRKLILDELIQTPKVINYLNTGNDSYLYLNLGQDGNDYIENSENKYTLDSIAKLKNTKFSFTLPVEELKAPHWVFYIRDLLLGAPYNLKLKELYSGGYQIYTSLDLRIQELAQAKIKDGVDRYGPSYRFQNSALVSIDPRSGEILAMVGSKGYNLGRDPNNKKFDPQVNVTTSIQSLGSSLKPWVAYMGFESGRYSAETRVKDVPKTFYRFYRPKNSDGRFMGEMSLRTALLESRNIPFIEMLYKLGDWRLGELMEKIGYAEKNDYGLAAAVGGVNETLLDHTAAYTGLANGGSVMAQKPVLKIVKPDSSLLFTAETKSIYELNRGAVGVVNNILGDKGFTKSTYGNKFVGRQKLAGKTGTSDSNKDTYYMGYGPKIVTGIWCGNNDNSRMSSQAFGSATALLIWNSYMREFFNKFPEYGENGSY